MTGRFVLPPKDGRTNRSELRHTEYIPGEGHSFSDRHETSCSPYNTIHCCLAQRSIIYFYSVIRLPVIAAVVVGMIVMAFLVESYHASGNPRVCTACHSMGSAGSTWRASNHKQFACVECHMPVSGTFSRVFYKLRAGLHDLWHETLRDYPASLSLSKDARTIVNGNCLRCHQSTVQRITMLAAQPVACTKCHRRTVHHVTKQREE